MSEIEQLAKDWFDARKELLALVSDSEFGKKPVRDDIISAWKKLSAAEWKLYDAIKREG